MSPQTDGGWAWFVAFGGFINLMFVDGTFVTFGLIYPHLLTAFDSSPMVTSLTGSLMPAFFLLSTPVAAGLIRRFDCRRVNFLGTFITSVSIFIASKCETIGPFAVTYGAMAGTGIGMIALTGHISVNSYFTKYRGLANGIVSSGAGVGVFIVSAVLQTLLDRYSWKDTLFIYSACVLHVGISACLMRPLIAGHEERIELNIENTEEELEITSTDTKHSDTSKRSLLNQKLITNRAEEFAIQQPDLLLGDDKLIPTEDETDKVPLKNIPQHYGLSLPDLYVRRDEENLVNSDNMHIRSLHAVYDNSSKHSRGKTKKHVQYALNPLLRKDIFYSGSIFRLHDYKVSASIEKFVDDMEMSETPVSNISLDKDDEQSQSSCRRCVFRMVSYFIDVSVFKYKVFLPMLCCAVLWQMGQFIPSTFLPDYCYSIGLSTGDVTIVMGIFGGMNIVGRLSAGCLANLKTMRTIWLCAFGSFMCSVACALFPLFKTFSLVCIFSGTFGYFIGYFPCLQAVLLVEYLGLSNLTSAMGVHQFTKGPAALFGPPLAGMVYQSTSDYVMTYVTAAAVFLLSAICQSFVPAIDKYFKTSNSRLDV